MIALPRTWFPAGGLKSKRNGTWLRNRSLMAAESDSSPVPPICISDLEDHARKTLEKGVWAYYYHGAADELTRVDNIDAFNR